MLQILLSNVNRGLGGISLLLYLMCVLLGCVCGGYQRWCKNVRYFAKVCLGKVVDMYLK
jgi:hypothetical protein